MEGTWLQHVRSCALHLLPWFLILETEAEVNKSKFNGAIRSPRLQRWSKVGAESTKIIFELKYKQQVSMIYILAAGHGSGPSQA